jgi:hypothetical protein
MVVRVNVREECCQEMPFAVEGLHQSHESVLRPELALAGCQRALVEWIGLGGLAVTFE